MDNLKDKVYQFRLKTKEGICLSCLGSGINKNKLCTTCSGTGLKKKK